MANSIDHLTHALHNEKVCQYLELNPDFSDWMITTAFYASLHFVSHKIFPYKSKTGTKETTYKTIDEYYSYKKSFGVSISKHSVLADLVDLKCDKICEDYRWLLDMSFNARYSNYHQDILIAKKAKTLLLRIKKHCTS